MTQMKFTLRCPQCGSTRFKTRSPRPSPDDPVTCAQCGTPVDVVAERKRLEEEARAAVEERRRDRAK